MKQLVTYLDKTAAIAGLIIGLALTWLLREDYPELGIALCLACAAYLLISNRLPQASLSFKFQIGKRGYLVLNIIFFGLFAYSTFTVLLHTESYLRPVEYFVAISVLVAILAAEIVAIPSGKSYAYFALVKIILIGVSLQWIPQAMFPSLTGVDVFGHSRAISVMLSQEHIPSSYPYAKMPLMSLALGVTSLVTGLDYKFSGMLTIGVFYLATSVFIFLITQRLFDTKTGLLSALMVIISDWVIGNGLWVIPNTMGIALSILLMYMIFRGERRTTFTSAILLMMAALIMTHSLGAFAFSIALAFAWLGTELYHQLYHRKSEIVNITMPVLFIVATLAYWMYVSGHIGHIAYSIQVAFGLEEEMGYPGIVARLSPIARSELLLNRCGLLFFYFLSIIGILAALSRWLTNPERFSFTVAAAAISLAAFLGNPWGLTELIPQRFMAYSEIFLSLPAALGIVLLTNVLNKDRWKFLMLFGLTLTLSFFLITSPVSNRESPIYSQNTAYRLSFTRSEVEAARTISQIYQGNVLLGLPYDSLFSLPTSGNLIENLISRDFRKVKELVIIREYGIKQVTYSGTLALKLDYDPRVVLKEQGFSRIYDCGTVSAFLP